MYDRPPITEAAIEIRFAEPIKEQKIEAASEALAGRYPGLLVIENRGLQFNLAAGDGPAPSATNLGRSFRRASTDQSESVLIAPSSFMIGQLPDYPGWEVFSLRFQRDWTIWKRSVGYQKITRVGVRYINRLDLPVNASVVHEENYLNLHLNVPAELGPSMNYGLQASFLAPAIQGLVLINSGVVPSPVEQHISILLDIDLSRERDLPQKDDDLFALLADFGIEKNRIFEACITDKSRERF